MTSQGGDVLGEGGGVDGRGGGGECVPELHQVKVEVGVEGGAEGGGDGEEEECGDVDADEGEFGLAFGDEEVGILDAEERDADEGEVGEEAEPAAARGAGERVNALDPCVVTVRRGRPVAGGAVSEGLEA